MKFVTLLDQIKDGLESKYKLFFLLNTNMYANLPAYETCLTKIIKVGV